MFYLRKDNLINLGLFTASVIILIWPAIENGYPLLFSDSATYMVSGQTNKVPIDRPITYGLFVRHLSLSFSMWFIVIIQSIIVNYILFLFIKYFVGCKRCFLVLFIVTFFLSLTGIDYYTSFIVPDIFTSLSILSLFLLFYLRKDQYLDLTLLSIVFLFSVVFHLSHLPLALAVLFVICAMAIILNPHQIKSILIRGGCILIVFCLGLFSLMLINYSLGAGFKLSRSNNIVLAARLIESGLVNEYLKNNCGKVDFDTSYAELCDYVDEFDRWPAAGFYLWVEDSPLYANGCAEKGWENCWIEKDEAYGDLIKDVLNEPGNPKDLIALSIVGTLKQLITFEQVKLDPVNLEGLISSYYEDDLFTYTKSNQANSPITFKEENIKEALIFDISVLVVLMFIFIYWKKLDSCSKLLLVVMLFTLLLNAFLCATLSNVVPRYQGRIAFLLPFAVVMILLKMYKASNSSKVYNISKII